MNKFIQFFTLALLITSLGCGKLEKAADAGENVETMKTIMGDMAKTTSDMKAGMDKTNAGMDKTNAGMDKTNSGMERTNNSMDKMVGAIHDQQVVIPFQELLKPENSKILSPIPERMMPYGKKMAEAARADELIETTYLWLKAIDETYPDKSVDKEGNEQPYSTEQIGSINHDKLARYMALNVLAGFTPQATIEEIVQVQIVNGGRYRDTAYQYLMLRAQFIRDILLDSSLLSSSLNDIGKVEEAVKYMQQLDYLAKLPFAAKIGIKTKGFLKPFDNVTENLSPKDIGNKWNSLASKTDLDCKIEKTSYTHDDRKNEELYNQELGRLATAKETIKTFQKTWSPKPK